MTSPLNLLRNWLRLPIIPFPAGMTPSGPSDFSLQALTQNVNVYAEGVTTVASSGTNLALTPAQVLAKNIVITAGASGAFAITLPSTTTLLDAMSPTMPLDGSFYFPLEIWNKATTFVGTLTAADADTTMASADNTLPSDTFGKWMVRVNPIVSSQLGRPTTVTITRVASGVSTGNAGTGTVLSVAQTVPVEFVITGSPVTTTGTLAITKAVETANTVWAGPTTGVPAQPTFRALVAADITAAVTGTQPYVVSCTYNDKPGASLILVRHPFPIAVTFPVSLTNSEGQVDAVAAAQTDFDLRKSTDHGATSASIGTMRFAIGARFSTFVFAAPVAFAIGDVLTVVAPALADATLSGLGFSLLGVR